MPIILHDLSKPLRQRLMERHFHAPARFTPQHASESLVFYIDDKSLACARPAAFTVRLSPANHYLKGNDLRHVQGYPEALGALLVPLVAKVRRGHLAGWHLGRIALLERRLYDRVWGAAVMAHMLAAHAADDIWADDLGD